jgi:hypothetical protein
LRQLFPDFAGYARRVPALWPTLTPARLPVRFRWELYVRNREYQALIGFLVGALYLLIRAAWF